MKRIALAFLTAALVGTAPGCDLDPRAVCYPEPPEYSCSTRSCMRNPWHNFQLECSITTCVQEAQSVPECTTVSDCKGEECKW